MLQFLRKIIEKPISAQVVRQHLEERRGAVRQTLLEQLGTFLEAVRVALLPTVDRNPESPGNLGIRNLREI